MWLQSSDPPQAAEPIEQATTLTHLIARGESILDKLSEEDFDLRWHPNPPHLLEGYDSRPLRQIKVDRPRGEDSRRV
jgi:hypothetical protein